MKNIFIAILNRLTPRFIKKIYYIADYLEKSNASIHDEIINYKNEIGTYISKSKNEIGTYISESKNEIGTYISESKDHILYIINKDTSDVVWQINSEMLKIVYISIIEKYFVYQKKNYDFNIEKIFENNNRIMYSFNSYSNISTSNIEYLFGDRFMYFDDFHSKLDFIILHGIGLWYENLRSIEIGINNMIPIISEEDGFIRSCSTWVNTDIPKIYTNSLSFTFSNLPHYFADEITTLEYMINNKDLVIGEKELSRARILINKIVSNKISKYNHQPIYIPDIGDKNRKKVLVIDQSYGDLSIKYGWSNDATFKKMLECAIKDNPDSDIIIKTHPDALIKDSVRKTTYYSLDDVTADNIHLISYEINPISILEIVDKVYVCTSQFGFEALMLGKEVHVFGMPFYAGWGITIDYQNCSRRTAKRSLEEIFYITYIMYTYYIDPYNKKISNIEDTIDYLIELRRKYFKEFNVRCDDLNLIN